MIQRRIQPGMCLLLLAMVLPVAAHAASSVAVVKGVVRDPKGAPQMGALVQLLAPDATAIASAITDLQGRYHIRGILPGRYQVRASASLFLPALRRNLQLGAGKQLTVDLRLSALVDAVRWAAPKPRSVDEPGDDWTWTLRSPENRPILRVLDDGTAVLEMASEEGPHRTFTHRRVAVMSGVGAFGGGGIHSVVTADHSGKSGSASVVRVDIGSGVVSSTDLSAGYARSLGYAGTARMAAYYQKHPELGQKGMSAVSMLNAYRMEMGDSFAVEAGSLLRTVRSGGVSQGVAMPFVKVTTAPIGGIVVSYNMATARELQGFEDMDSMRPQMPAAFASGNKLLIEQGRHQELSVSERAGWGSVQASIYSDNLTVPVIQGVGTPTDDFAKANNVVTDSVTGTFRALAPAYQSRGVRVTVSQPLTHTLWITGEYDTGNVLAGQTLSDIRPEWSQAGTLSMEGKWTGGSDVRVAYRWQPAGTLTAVNSYQPGANRAFLSVFLRKPLHYHQILPNGLEVVADVSNLLAQGYQPVGVSADGGTLYFAQTARAIQGGLAFTF